MLSRRAFLLSAPAVAIAATLPLPAAAAPMATGKLAAMPELFAYAVGTPGEFDWQAIWARTPEEAFREWFTGRHGYDPDDPDALTYDPEYVERVEKWDGLETVSGADWFAAGKGYCCERCGYETYADIGGRVVAGEVVCETCLTFADRIAVDPDDVVEDLANRIADEGESETRAWLDLQKIAIPDELWLRAVAEAQS